MKNNISRPITITLSDEHLASMVKNHLLKGDEVSDIPKISKIAQQLVDEALGLSRNQLARVGRLGKGP